MHSKENTTSDADAKARDPIPDLLAYCQAEQVYFSPKIAPRRVPGRGLGIYVTSTIAKDEQIIHVPTTTLFTTKCIPETFASTRARKGIPVHALLAAYFAFGTDEQHRSFTPWMATWPKLSDFSCSVPLLWNESCQEPFDTQAGLQDRENQRPTANTLTALPPPLTGGYLTSRTAVRNATGSTTLVAAQTSKLENHVKSLQPILDVEVYTELQTARSPTWYRFAHAWLCVNTRCFSYTPSGTKRPSDPNEAMALCPGMDLFNHAAKANVLTKYDKTGYFARANRALQPGEEIVFNYGAHVNDVLWTEYGFLLDEVPAYDAIRIDKIVLLGLSDGQKELLKEHGYLGEYWLAGEGLCWRTEVVAWLSILSRDQWERMLEGQYDPEEEEENAANAGAATNKKRKKGLGLVKAHRVICASWIARVEADAKTALRILQGMTDRTLVECLGDSDTEIQNQRLARGLEEVAGADMQKFKRDDAQQRHVMCVKRWQQIMELSKRVRENIEQLG